MAGRQSVSDVFDLYDRGLSSTRGRLEKRVIDGTKALDLFYKEYLSTQLVRYADLFSDKNFRREMHKELEERHHSSSLRFWAIDGACLKVDTSDLAIFYGGAYVVKGDLGLKDNPPELSYRESEPGDDSSLVAYLPLSPEDLTMLDPEDRFIVSDAELLSTSGLDTALMLLAENYLCYRGASSTERPHLILWDHSLSSVLANATPNVKKLRFAGVTIGGEIIWYPDLLVGYSKPWNSVLDVPSRKAHRLWERAIAQLFESQIGTLSLKNFAAECKLSVDKVISQTKLIWECDRYGYQSEGGNPADALVKREGDTLTLNKEYKNSPAKVERLYNHFCGRLFRNKDPSVLLYEFVRPDGAQQTRFLSSEELSFLMAIGLRLTFEECWRNGVMLVGVVKDSGSTYFTNHYLSVLRNLKRISFTPRFIPSTDRLVFERIPFIDESLSGLWSSTEFDSVFMTLRMKKDWGSTQSTLQGVRGDVLVPPNLIMRSIVQFHLVRAPPMEPSMGHAIFVDRLVDPAHLPPSRLPVVAGDPGLGTVEPFFHEKGSVENREQELTMYLLSVLTRNVFPEVVGYPDPLHLADRGAKSVLRMVEPMLRSSEQLGRANPLHKTLRQLRGG